MERTLRNVVHQVWASPIITPQRSPEIGERFSIIGLL